MRALDSISKQTFVDLEVIVGNDYTDEVLSVAGLGILDPRIRFINHPRNLGEVGNMNALLEGSRGRYFTWLADDDLYAPDFLEAVHWALVTFELPPCVFSSYEVIPYTARPDMEKRFSGRGRILTGRQFLRQYLQGSVSVIGAYGVFDRGTLREMGGYPRLCDAPIGMYGEHLLLMKCGLLRKVAYIDEPLVLFREVDDSGGWTSSANSEHYEEAERNLIGESLKVLGRPELRSDFYGNFAALLRLPLSCLAGRMAAQDRCTQRHRVVAYLVSLKEGIGTLKGTVLYWIALFVLIQAGARYVLSSVAAPLHVRLLLRRVVPPRFMGAARRASALLRRTQRRAFWGPSS
jgi:glycosyltransferase involved in cell wall biosynthesis